MKLNYGNADIVINWAGGLHHAKKAEVRHCIHRAAPSSTTFCCGACSADA